MQILLPVESLTTTAFDSAMAKQLRQIDQSISIAAMKLRKLAETLSFYRVMEFELSEAIYHFIEDNHPLYIVLFLLPTFCSPLQSSAQIYLRKLRECQDYYCDDVSW